VVPGLKRPEREANRLMPRLIMYEAVPLLPLCGVDRENLNLYLPCRMLDIP